MKSFCFLLKLDKFFMLFLALKEYWRYLFPILYNSYPYFHGIKFLAAAYESRGVIARGMSIDGDKMV